MKGRLVQVRSVKGRFGDWQVDDEQEENGKMSDKCKKKNRRTASRRKK